MSSSEALNTNIPIPSTAQTSPPTAQKNKRRTISQKGANTADKLKDKFGEIVTDDLALAHRALSTKSETPSGSVDDASSTEGEGAAPVSDSKTSTDGMVTITPAKGKSLRDRIKDKLPPNLKELANKVLPIAIPALALVAFFAVAAAMPFAGPVPMVVLVLAIVICCDVALVGGVVNLMLSKDKSNDKEDKEEKPDIRVTSDKPAPDPKITLEEVKTEEKEEDADDDLLDWIREKKDLGDSSVAAKKKKQEGLYEDDLEKKDLEKSSENGKFHGPPSYLPPESPEKLQEWLDKQNKNPFRREGK